MSASAARDRREGLRVGAAAIALCLALGSIHAFSVFIAPLEAALGASRAAVSAAYSLALVTLTAMVLAGPWIYPRLRGHALPVAAGVAAIGAQVAAWAGGLPGLWLGYALIFGAANGLGYGFGLQIAAHANPGREGLAMGAVTAAYAIGAAAGAPAFEALIQRGGVPMAMTGLAAALLAAGAGAVILTRRARIALPEPGDSARRPDAPVALLWLGYGAGVASGLMAIGHAAEIARAAGMARALWAAPAVIALANMAGSLIGGALTDRLSPRTTLTALPLVAAAALAALTLGHGAGPALAALGIIGFVYGGLIAAYPAMIARRWGMAAGPRIYGRVFTAWGAAGLTAPLAAGALYDLTGTYAAPLAGAAVLSLVSALIARRLP